ncbi:serine O-acetyltransferase [Alistipes putredinis]|uniref:serine O-acetyltransferase n=1 Tax=Alistipes putredinis TaxID=28117 RepID=UPI003A8862D2
MIALKEDLSKFVGNRGGAAALAIFLINPCFHSVAWFRLSSFLFRHRLEAFAKLAWSFNRFAYHVDIDYRAKIAPGFRLVHGLGVVIGGGMVSEGPMTVYQNVTIGGSRDRVREKTGGGCFAQPHFGRNVTIYSGASVFGPVYIGDNAMIKAGRIVTKDVGAEEHV